jgi:predicted nucleic acid-binding Zn ribbon protein
MSAEPLRTTRQVADLLAELLQRDDFAPWAVKRLAGAEAGVRAVLDALELETGCEVCGAALPELSTGRPRRFCSDKCRQAHHRDRPRAAADPLTV